MCRGGSTGSIGSTINDHVPVHFHSNTHSLQYNEDNLYALFVIFLVALSTQRVNSVLLNVETVPIDKFCCTYQKNNFCNSAQKGCPEGHRCLYKLKKETGVRHTSFFWLKSAGVQYNILKIGRLVSPIEMYRHVTISLVTSMTLSNLL